MRERLAAEAEAAEAIGDEDDLGPTYPSAHPPREPSMVYSVRIPVGLVERLRQIAAEKGVAPSALVREWVVERLESGRPTRIEESFARQLEEIGWNIFTALLGPQATGVPDLAWAAGLPVQG